MVRTPMGEVFFLSINLQGSPCLIVLLEDSYVEGLGYSSSSDSEFTGFWSVLLVLLFIKLYL